MLTANPDTHYHWKENLRCDNSCAEAMLSLILENCLCLLRSFVHSMVSLSLSSHLFYFLSFGKRCISRMNRYVLNEYDYLLQMFISCGEPCKNFLLERLFIQCKWWLLQPLTHVIAFSPARIQQTISFRLNLLSLWVHKGLVEINNNNNINEHSLTRPQSDNPRNWECVLLPLSTHLYVHIAKHSTAYL